MIFGNRGYNVYDVNKKNKRGSVRMEELNDIDYLFRCGLLMVSMRFYRCWYILN